jgi:hypothetical protein
MNISRAAPFLPLQDRRRHAPVIISRSFFINAFLLSLSFSQLLIIGIGAGIAFGIGFRVLRDLINHESL